MRPRRPPPWRAHRGRGALLRRVRRRVGGRRRRVRSHEWGPRGEGRALPQRARVRRRRRRHVEASNVPRRARAGAPLELLRVFADAGLCVEDAWPLAGGEILVAVAGRPPRPSRPRRRPRRPTPRRRPGRRGRARRPPRRSTRGRVALRRLRALWGAAARRPRTPPAERPLWDAGGSAARGLARGLRGAARRAGPLRRAGRLGRGVRIHSADGGDRPGRRRLRRPRAAAPPEVALTVTVGGRPAAAAQWLRDRRRGRRPI